MTSPTGGTRDSGAACNLTDNIVTAIHPHEGVRVRHVIVEGPDGSGKDNLIRELEAHLGLPVHPRFVQSTGGPPPDLDRLTEIDLQTPAFSDGHHTWIYNRHPVISEPIYGTAIRGEPLGKFRYSSWLERQRRRVANRSLVVWCLPPYTEVFNNVHRPAGSIVHMEGVDERIYDIYTAYERYHKLWPGPFLVHDYTVNKPGSASRANLIARIRRTAQEGSHDTTH
jgi:hypothetical protein